MVHSYTTFKFSERALLPALLISLGLHLLAVAFLHPLPTAVDRIEPALDVVMQTPKPVPPPPPPPPKPEPPKPTPKLAPPPPQRAPLPPPADERPALPTPVAAQVPQVIATAPVREVVPAFVAPAPEARPAVEPALPDEEDFGKYGSLLARELAKHKQYPRIAQMRGWQGTVRIKLEVDANGLVTSSTVSESSSFDALDKQALEMVKKASPLPLPPESLRHRPFVITVPVTFRLE